MMDVTNILVPTDFSLSSLKAVELGHSMAEQHNAILHLLHVVDPVQKHTNPGFSTTEEALFAFAETEFAKTINQIPSSKVEIKQALVKGKPYQQILNYSKENHIDLIIMATRGKSNHNYALMGSVAERVVRFSGIPVITLKSDTIYDDKKPLSINTNLAENWVG